MIADINGSLTLLLGWTNYSECSPSITQSKKDKISKPFSKNTWQALFSTSKRTANYSFPLLPSQWLPQFALFCKICWKINTVTSSMLWLLLLFGAVEVLSLKSKTWTIVNSSVIGGKVNGKQLPSSLLRVLSSITLCSILETLMVESNLVNSLNGLKFWQQLITILQEEILWATSQSQPKKVLQLNSSSKDSSLSIILYCWLVWLVAVKPP